MNQHIANYTKLRECFTALLSQQCEKRILLLDGASGIGKTTLLDYYLQQAITQNQPVILLDLETEARSIYDFFWQNEITFKRYGSTHLTAQFSKENTSSTINASHIAQRGQGNAVNIISQSAPLSELEQSRQLLNAWLKDVENIQQPFVLLLDNFDKAVPEFQQWLAGHLLPAVVHYPMLRVVITGEKVPTPGSMWKFCAQQHHLKGVSEAEHWIEFADKQGYQLPDSDPKRKLQWISGICQALYARPSEIIKILESFNV